MVALNENEIYLFFDDLNEKAKKEYLSLFGLESKREGNLETFPIAILAIPENLEKDD